MKIDIKKIIQFGLIILLVINANLSYAQTNIDSLGKKLNIYKKNGNDKKTAETLAQIYKHTYRQEPFLAVQRVMNALQIYTKLKDSSGIALMNRYIGDNNFRKKDFGMAMRFYKKSNELFRKTNNQEEIAYSLLKIGDTYLAQGIDSKAVSNYQKAKIIFEKIQSQKGLSFVYDKEAIINFDESKDSTAFALLNKSLLIRKRFKNDTLIALSYDNIADLHIKLEEYDSAFVYIKKSLEIYKKCNNKLKQADDYLKIGEKYIYDDEYSKAKKYFKQALKIYIPNKIKDKIAISKIKLAYALLREKDFNKAKNITNEAIVITKIYEYHGIRKEAYKILSDIYYNASSFEAAYRYMQMYAKLTDSIANLEKSKHLIEQQVNIATEEEEKRINIYKKNQELQEVKLKKNEADRKFIYLAMSLLAVVVIFVTIFGFYFYKMSKKTRKNNIFLIEKNEEINQQKEEITTQNDRLEDVNLQLTKHRDEIELKNNRITASINYASRIQRAMLPKMKEVREFLPESFVMLSPKDLVSGDFFWYANITDENREEKTIITAVDCTGHGIPGAFMSMIADAYLNQIIYQQKIYSPEKILTELNKGIVNALQQEKTKNTDGMDMAICVIDKKNKKLEYAGAKNPLVYIQNEEIKFIKGGNISIGGFLRGSERVYEKHTVDISTPTIFYIYSDGFQDQFGGKDNKKYMAKRFRNLLLDIHKQPMNEQATTLAVELDDWKGDKDQMDDVLIIGVKL